jgi:nucleotide-binding universal stress UspA family protein
MPVIPYYRGRPAHVWINAMASKRRRDPPHLASQLSKRPAGSEPVHVPGTAWEGHLLQAPIHPVIVGYDGSASSRNALAYASGLARKLGRPLLMIYVAYVPVSSGSPAVVLAGFGDAEQSERWLLSELAEVADQGGMDVHVRARRGNPARELAAAAAQHGADALVIGASASFRRYFGWSVPAWLVKRACCPVIVVP